MGNGFDKIDILSLAMPSFGMDCLVGNSFTTSAASYRISPSVFLPMDLGMNYGSMGSGKTFNFPTGLNLGGGSSLSSAGMAFPMTSTDIMSAFLMPDINNIFGSFRSRHHSYSSPDYSNDPRYNLRKSDYTQMIIEEARDAGLDPYLMLAVVQNESNYDPKADSGEAFGLAQLVPGTADLMGVDINDPRQNVRGGARYLKQQLDTFGDLSLAIAAYNAGPGAVKSAGYRIPQNGETPNYVAKVLATYKSASNSDVIIPPESEAV